MADTVIELSSSEIECISGGGPLAGAAATAGVIGVAAGAAALIPGPGTIAFGTVAAAMGLLNIGLSYADSF